MLQPRIIAASTDTQHGQVCVFICRCMPTRRKKKRTHRIDGDLLIHDVDVSATYSAKYNHDNQLRSSPKWLTKILDKIMLKERMGIKQHNHWAACIHKPCIAIKHCSLDFNLPHICVYIKINYHGKYGNSFWNMDAYAATTRKIQFRISKNSEQNFAWTSRHSNRVCPVSHKTDIFRGLCKKD